MQSTIDSPGSRYKPMLGCLDGEILIIGFVEFYNYFVLMLGSMYNL